MKLEGWSAGSSLSCTPLLPQISQFGNAKWWNLGGIWALCGALQLGGGGWFGEPQSTLPFPHPHFLAKPLGLRANLEWQMVTGVYGSVQRRLCPSPSLPMGSSGVLSSQWCRKYQRTQPAPQGVSPDLSCLRSPADRVCTPLSWLLAW